MDADLPPTSFTDTAFSSFSRRCGLVMSTTAPGFSPPAFRAKLASLAKVLLWLGFYSHFRNINRSRYASGHHSALIERACA